MSTDGVQNIIKEIEKTSDSRVSELLSDAKAKADEIIRLAGQDATEKSGQVLMKAEQEAKRNTQRILAEARIKARRDEIAVREELVNKTFEKAAESLQTITAGENQGKISYKDVLISLIKEAAISSGADRLEVFARKADNNILTPELFDNIAKDVHRETKVKPSLQLSEESITVNGGAVVRSVDGKVRVDNTFEARLERFKETIRTEVAMELFGGDIKDE